ncbi:MAG: hypothetical protein N4A72_13665 [Bacteroidales bacterium]|jgi:hypothetical protein|nr:hypothetical protein [Bacteroidales bacterium]
MDTKTKSFFLKSSYYRSFWFVFIGIIIFFYSINNLNKTADDYPIVEGNITHTQIRWDDAPFDIKVNDRWYSIYYEKMFPVLTEKAIVGKRAKIWYNENNNIEQLIVDGEVIYPYSKATWLWIVLMIFGLFMSLGNVYYIIKYPSHAKGKE